MIDAMIQLVFFAGLFVALYGAWLIVDDKQKAYRERNKK